MAIAPINDPKTAPGLAGSVSATPQSSETDRQRARLKKATQEFESVFIGMMLKQMRKSMAGSNALFANSQESKLYQDMADDQTAISMSKTGSFGLATTLYKSLEPKLVGGVPTTGVDPQPQAAPKAFGAPAKRTRS